DDGRCPALSSGAGGTPQSLGVSVSQSTDGANWIMVVSSARSGKAYTATTLAIFKPDGANNLTATALWSLATAPNGCSLSKANSASTAVSVGDRILCKTSWYVTDASYQVSDGTKIGRASW